MTKMTDDNQDTHAVSAPRRRYWLPLLLLTVLGLAAWQIGVLVRTIRQDDEQVRGLVRDVNALEVQGSKLDGRASDLVEISRRNNLEVSALNNRLDEQSQVVSRLNEQYQGGRTRTQMAVVEHLLMTANDRLLLEHDVDGAITALELADQRLGALGEPRLFNVRRAITEERASLRAVPHADLAAAALTFSSLIGRAQRLPLRARVPDHFEARSEHVELAPEAGWAGRAWASVKEAMSGVFMIRRNRGPAPRLLPADQESLVYQVLALKLEGARLAMLRGDAASFRDLCDSSAAWIRDYFRPDDPGVLAAQAELERLRPLSLNPSLPDITRSLALLRAQMEPSAR
jgi:uroporphyrin-3 C-methyltransferase